MINLTPPSAKKSILREYWLRVISVWLFLLASTSLIVASLLMPTYVLLQGKISAYQTEAEAAIAQADAHNLSTASLVTATRQALGLIKKSEQVTFTEVINLFSSLPNPGVGITAYELSRAADGSVENLTLNGTANTRQDLADFREILINHPRVEKIELPISNLALDRNIEFTVRVTLKSDK